MPRRSDDSLFSLPEVQMASRTARSKLNTLLREAHSLRHVERRLKDIKKEIVELLQANDLQNEQGQMGCRSGELCALARYQDGKRAISRELLIENGVTPGQIEASMKQGEGYWVVELAQIGEGGSGR